MAQIPPILVTCNCGYMLHAPADYAGQQMQCPNCGDPVRIPATLSPKPTPAYNPNKSSPAPWIILGIVAILLIGVIIYALVKKGNEPREISGTGGSGKPNPTSNGGDANGDVAGLLEWPSEFSPLQPGSIEPSPTYPHDPEKLATPFPVEGEFIRSAPIINDGLTAAIQINDDNKDRFDFYQLESGEKIASIPISDGDSRILDLAPEGGRVAISSGGEISIFELPGAQKTHTFQPITHPNAAISYGRFLGDRRLFLYGERSRIFGLWNLSLKRFDWAHRLPGHSNTPVAISPDWKLVWAATGEGILAFDLVNGASKGSLPTPEGLSDAVAQGFKDIHFSPDGKHMAATFGLVPKNLPVVVWDLEEASVVGEFEIQNDLFGMLDERYLLIGKYANFWLFDLHEARDVWMIRAKCEPERFATRASSAWFVSTKTSDPNRYLVNAPIDPASLIASAGGSDSPPVLDSGSKVALTVKGDTPEGDGEFVERIRAEITHLLEGRGFTVDSDGVIACEVTFTIKDTGKKRRYSKDGIVGTGGVEVPERQLLIDSTIKDEDATILWRNNQTIYQTRFVKDTPESEIAGFLLAGQWEKAEATVPKIKFPPRLWKRSVLGSTALTKDGWAD